MTASWTLVRLRADHPVDTFTSGTRPGAAEIDAYLRDSALIEQQQHLAAVWVVEDAAAAPGDPGIVGFFTLSPVSVRVDGAVLTSFGIAAPYRTIGGWLLGRMGLAVRHQGQDLGSRLVAAAIRKAKDVRDDIAGPLLVVDPKNDSLLQWYLRLDFGFRRVSPGDPRMRRLALKL